MNTEKSIIIGCDHAGYLLKEKIKTHLGSLGYTVTDVGTDSDLAVDYPLFAVKLCDRIKSGEFERGILVCGTGIGVSIAANRNKGIRAALCTSVELARLCSQHNNANVLCLGGRTTKEDNAYAITEAWLTTPFEGKHHQRRVDMLDQIQC
ncbi:MAG: ribose 5-phosphate isomerase B [Candidatus Raymondbacteria bacterium RifOxyA12_full_50_37]|uniref:Ribose 5-phosphate isomerase B n=1 Tax=Candidatus Raymondbacteria bacterium RIFOXYD12_FULL_49_13 TaxID=1817890 RepID=A0A1F7FKV9_UNCRA|nr:MAG: ribose 5-phosphate isomerase B [Candidatus Raymondbacteria bacterium RifOxyA12_full_50_37]OGJ85452.1 MAG: ribose 5-phosphate isomerase B [Candidatus Raymondbacteria bacterium RIFOXYA2_FULL_49_16]OGJ94960.1 MAG: ribose 5-phosphate isomerase B [Candidatus Raymondbacteria bacterium RIFOXYC2_FULL_50_21]OGJ99400.1 MAG: ribose 5-phosphate isomerase B [Candidatus Raymondbacteria bacterium RifOxyB12_full_50_8]OGK01894.1 MAG: ribose 5-phosphate isomerase B [Candidatus Raymondbacteria bacterium R